MSLPARAITLSFGLTVAAVIGALAGVASALFLWLLDRATAYRLAHEAVVFALPIAGLALGLGIERFGAALRAGNDHIIEALTRAPGQTSPPIPARLAPLVLAGTVLTHLFGGSAGREGTAVQMGASLADLVARVLARLGAVDRQAAITAGVAGGFGSVFGTPFAGAMFAIEFATPGRVPTRALAHAVTAAVVGDLVTRAFGIAHTAYPAPAPYPLTPAVLGKWLVFAAAVAAASALFVAAVHAVKRSGRGPLARLPVRMALGGAVVVLLWQVLGADYLGLGIATIERAFVDPTLPGHAFATKALFTAATVGAGFPGGEVTPLFFVGATLGNLLAGWLDLPLALAAGVGMAAVFGTAARAPIALAIMAVELLGAPVLPHVALVLALARAFSPARGLYPAQHAH